MVIRPGIVTGKGHTAMIYQRFGKWRGVFSLLDLELVNFLTWVTEVAAIAPHFVPVTMEVNRLDLLENHYVGHSSAERCSRGQG